MGWLHPFGLKTRVLIDLDEENSNLMSVCSESFIFDRFRARNRTYVRTRTGKNYLGFPPSCCSTWKMILTKMRFAYRGTLTPPTLEATLNPNK